VASDGMADDGISYSSPSGVSSYAAATSSLRSDGNDTMVMISVNVIIAGRQFSSYVSFSPDKWRVLFVPCKISMVIVSSLF
jgi:hypothetical protein